MAHANGFIPLCSSHEAAALSEHHQPKQAPLLPCALQASEPVSRQCGDAGRDMVKLGAAEEVFRWLRSSFRQLWEASGGAPQKAAAWIFRAVPSSVLLSMSEGMPWADAVILRLRKLSLGPVWVPEAVPARRRLTERTADAVFCDEATRLQNI